MDHELFHQDLLSMTDKVSAFFPDMCRILESADFSNMDDVILRAGDLSSEFAECITRHLVRASEDESGMRNSILYLNLLNETRTMVRKAFLLMKEQRELFSN